MQILTEIGEIGVYMGDESYSLRPSLYAMTRLGEPADIVCTYANVMAGDLQDALAVIFACCEADLSAVFGCFESTEAGLKYVAGSAPQEHVVPLAQCLMKHGITGALEPLPRRHDEDPEYVDRFVARDHVALAMAHLGMSEKDAWNMTMTSLVGALRAKFPQQESNAPGARAPSKEEHEATMAWFDKIEAKRKAAQGAH